MIENSIENFASIKKSDRDISNLFWAGFIVYSVSYTISMSEQVNYIICQAFQSIGILVMILTSLSLIRFKIENKYLQFVFSLYCCWLVFIIVRGFRTDYDSIKFMLFDAWFGMLPYFVPLLLLFPKKPFFYKKMFAAIVILGVFYVFYDMLFLNDLLVPGTQNVRSQNIVEYFSRTLGITCLFILFTYNYHSKKFKYLAIIVISLIVFFALVRARRSLLATTLLALILSYMLYVFASRQKSSILILSMIGGVFLLIFGYEFFLATQDDLFASLLDRGLQDTRSHVEDCFYKDMTTKDWIIGRGMNGEYFCPGIDKGTVTGYRKAIETDYLQYVLKGGLVSLGLFLMIAIPAMIKGIFYSRNVLAKAAGVWIFYALLNMYPASINTFTMQYMLVWVCIGICYSEEIRNLPEENLRNYFNNPKKYLEDKLTLKN